MNPLLLFGGGAAVAYLLLRSQSAAAATTPAGPTNTGMQPTPGPPPAPQAPASVSTAIGVRMPTAPQLPIGTKPPQITTSAPPFLGEVAAPWQPSVQLTGRWGWPVPRWQGRAPVISDGFGSPRPPPYQKHQGVDVMFGRISSDPYPVGTPNGSKSFVMPDAWMAVAASDGVLWSAGHTERGFSVVIDHGNVATLYQHLEVLLVPEAKAPAKGTPKDQLIKIKAGQPLGVIGADPLDQSHIKHLHFELLPSGSTGAIDPQPLMKSWQVFTPDDVAPFLQAMRRNAAKKPARRPDLVQVRGYERRWPGTSLNPPR